ncbi:tetratricopeptide repeat protein [Zavarzinella formosa]|uniref:tetratricopeptide repeat protein n=1 Tax=Zavarzinella formosa TaxID=360055 RepID=UPI0012FA7C7E|nr:tetratricopeptide repeat protein [Zavarzinella formosa]
MNRASAIVLLIALGLIAYANCYSKAFVFDDVGWILESPHFGDVREYVASYPTRPLLMLSNWVIQHIGAYNPAPHHVLNVAIHLGSALTLFGLVWRTLRLPRFHGRYRQSAVCFGFAVALLWMAHPIQTQSVTYIIQRGESMAGLFYLLILYGLLRAETSWHHRRAWLAVSLVSLFLGFCSKEILMTAPGAVMLFDRVFLATSVREMIRRRRGYYSLFLVIWGSFVSWHFMRALAVDKGIGFGMEAVTPRQYALTQCGVILHYLRLSVWPVGQSIDYDGWPWCRTVGEAMPELAIIIGLLVITVVLLWKRPAAGFVAAWFFLILIPTSSFLPIVDPVFEHRLYLSLASVAVGVVWAGDWLLRNRPRIKILVLFVIAGSLIALTLRRNEDYRSGVTLWQSALEQRPDNMRAKISLSHAYITEGRGTEAIALLTPLIECDPANYLARHNLVVALEMNGRLAEAEHHARVLTEQWPSDIGYQRMLAQVRAKMTANP